MLTSTAHAARSAPAEQLTHECRCKKEEKMKKNRTDEEVKKPKKMTSIGGQALMEGLMMIGPEKMAMAVRLPDGTIHVETEPIGKSSRAAKIPFVRGSVKIFRQMVTGTRYILRSAQFIEDDIEEKEKTDSPAVQAAAAVTAAVEAYDEASSVEQPDSYQEPHLPVKEGKKARGQAVKAEKKKETKAPGRFEQLLIKNANTMLYISAILGILLSVGLFILLPNLLTNLTIGLWIDKNASFANNLVFSLVEGALRISIFIGYLALATNLKDIRRLWMYHGAEHKTIFCYESGMPLTVANVRGFSKHHPRCGTAFMFIVLLMSIIIFSFVPGINIIVDMLIRLACVPILASLSYEIIHWSSRHDNVFTRILAWPGLMLQRLTTKEPDDLMIEVAIAAMVPVIPAGERGDEW